MVKKVTLDFNREKRASIPEVVFAIGKDKQSLLYSISEIYKKTGKVLVTKCTRLQLRQIKNHFKGKPLHTDESSSCAIVGRKPERQIGTALIVAAGTADYKIAEEAAVCAEFFGLKVEKCYDCGVAGIHRLNKPLRLLKTKKIDVVIVIAGMEGALPSVIAGLVKQPVVAVPTSVGYGAHYKGIASLLTMLNSCSPGVTVVNIDNGFGAAAAAYKMIKWLKKH